MIPLLYANLFKLSKMFFELKNPVLNGEFEKKLVFVDRSCQYSSYIFGNICHSNTGFEM